MRERLSALTSVRFFAAIWVVAFHQTAANGWLYPSLVQGPAFIFHAMRTGYVAVGLFFTLSGFILAFTYSKPPLNTRSFLAARFARIYPVYALGLLLALPSVVLPWRHHHLPPVGTAAATLILPTLLLQAWHPVHALDFNSPGWSLSAEAFFYLMFPLLLPLASNKSRRQLLLLGLAAALPLCFVAPLLSVCLNLHWFGRVPATDIVGDQTWGNLVQFNPLLRLPEFLFGMIVAQLFLRRPVGAQRDGWKWYLPGMTGVGALCGIFSPHIPHPILHCCVLLFFGMMIYGLACGGGVIDKLLSHPWLVRLGQASYAMYILHAPLIWWTYWFKPGARLANTHPLALLTVYLLVLTFCSLLVFALVEEPARQYLRRKLTVKACAVPSSSPSPVFA